MHCRKRSKYSLAHQNTELSGYVHARPGGIRSDQSNFTTSSLEIALEIRVSSRRSLQSIFSEPWQNETRISCGNSSAEKRVSHSDDAILRVWTRVMTDTYPVQTYLHKIGAVQSPLCPHCSDNAIETLTHFACVCPKFREARTAAHNQLRAVVAAC